MIGADPREATPELGEQGLELAAERAAAVLERALREPARDALAAGLAALERIWELRQELPREDVPPVQTPAWIRHLEAFREGRWQTRSTRRSPNGSIHRPEGQLRAR